MSSIVSMKWALVYLNVDQALVEDWEKLVWVKTEKIQWWLSIPILDGQKNTISFEC
jgi:hypothetical protein